MTFCPISSRMIEKSALNGGRRCAIRRGLSLLGLCAALASATAGVPARSGNRADRVVTPRVPAAAADMLVSALLAVNQHQPKRIAPFVAVSAESFRWIASK